MNIVLLLLAFAAGSALTVQAAVNSQLADGLGGNTVIASLVSFGLGTFALAAFAICRGSFTVTTIAQLPSQPLWTFSGGLLGALAVFCTVLLAPRIGLATLFALVIAGQLLTSLMISHFGLMGGTVRHISGIKLAGVFVMLVGVGVTLFGDRLTAYLSRNFNISTLLERPRASEDQGC
jgi:transporter family-2 protein